MRQKTAFGLILFSLTGIVTFLAVAHGPAEIPLTGTEAVPAATSTVADALPAPAPYQASAATTFAVSREARKVQVEPSPELGPVAETSIGATTTPAATAEAPAPLAQLTIVAHGTSIYPIIAPEGTTLIEAMHNLEQAGFSFTSREYSGMGAFVDSIQGKKNADGYYWILSINGSKSSLGASSVVLHQGDEIEWRYEQGY